MDRRQTLIVVVLVVFLLSALVAVVYFAQGSGVTQAALGSTKRFTAKSGTTRDNAVALSSSKRESSGATASGSGRGTGSGGGKAGYVPPGLPIPQAADAPVEVRSLSRPENEDEMSEVDLAVFEAMNSIAPARAIARLEAALDGALKPGEASEIHRTLGQLHAQKNPPDTIRAQAEFDRARATAFSTEARQAVQLAEAKMRIAQGDDEAARVQLQLALAEENEDSPPGLEMGVLLGQLHERAGDLAAAEKVYRETFDSAQAMKPTDGADSMRLAGLRLSRLYRGQARDEEADKVVTEVKRHLDRSAPESGALDQTP